MHRGLSTAPVRLHFKTSGESTGVICLSKCQKTFCHFFNASFRKIVEEDILPDLFGGVGQGATPLALHFSVNYFLIA